MSETVLSDRKQSDWICSVSIARVSNALVSAVSSQTSPLFDERAKKLVVLGRLCSPPSHKYSSVAFFYNLEKRGSRAHPKRVLGGLAVENVAQEGKTYCVEGKYTGCANPYVSRVMHHICLRPYHRENSGSRPISEDKHGWARLVLGWETTWEPRVS